VSARKPIDLGDLERLADLVADRVVDRLTARSSAATTGELVDARTLAGILGVSRDYVYEHAAQLGGVKLGGGPKAPWRFEVAKARAALDGTVAPGVPAPVRPRPGRPKKTSSAAPLLAYPGWEE
jgi:hypothetical protein